MPSLKDLRNRIRSVKSTQKITTAMKLVAAAKLRRAQEQAEAARPYAQRLNDMIGTLGSRLAGTGGAPKLLAGSGADKSHLVIVATSDRGLCGAFNASILREARLLLRQLTSENKSIKLMCLGRRGRDGLRREYGQLMIEAPDVMGKRRIAFSDADQVANQVRRLFESGEVDVVTIVYARFKSAISQIITRRQLIPAPMPEKSAAATSTAMVEYEPDEETILAALLPRNLSVQIYGALLENAASEHGARMTAMDNATRNAGDMINRLTLNYNRTRQAVITKELIEIISGAEAV
ncbi:MAG: F0F1 ATP synthase subunit gamma [Elsteraceae bacterium]